MKLRPIHGLVLLPALALSLAAARPEDKKTDASGTWAVDGVHSSVIFKVKHAQASWSFGRFNDVAGSFTLDAAAPEKSKVDITIQAASIDTANKQRDDHLKSPGFFDVKTFPTATFSSTKVARKGEHGFAVTGDLTVHGVKKSVTIDMEHTGTSDMPQLGKRTGFWGALKIQRADYGITYGSGGALGDEVELWLSIEGTPK